MEEEFRALLQGEPAVTDFVPVTRINFGAHPQGVPFPGIVLNVITGAEGLVMNGANGLFEGIIQVDCYGMTVGQTKQIAKAATALLHPYRGGNFRLIRKLSERASREGGTNEAERPYRVSMDFSIGWRAV